MRHCLFALWLAFLFALAVPMLAEAQIYVDQDATGAGDGTSWADAYPDLQTAIDNAGGSDALWVAEGIYTPDSEGDSFTITGDQDGIELYGGFDGTETSRDQRAPEEHRTILSGDIAGDDTDPDGDGIIENASDIAGDENAHHVLVIDGGNGIGPDIGANVTNATVIDGMVVTAGQADGSNPGNAGGGLFCDGGGPGNECSPALQNIVFAGNEASRFGGAMLNDSGVGGRASPQVREATFSGNMARDGGAVFNTGSFGDPAPGTSSPTIVNTTFIDNTADFRGGAIFNNGGGGEASPQITNTAIIGNSASLGGAIYNIGSSIAARPTITNATLTDNTARNEGGAIFNDGPDALPEITNSILWGNSAEDAGDEIYNLGTGSGDTPVLTHTIIEGGVNGSGVGGDSNTDGGGNVDQDPLFTHPSTPTGPDERFQTGDDGINVGAGSPAIDAGTNGPFEAGGAASDVSTDITGVDRRQDQSGSGTPTVNIGAYEALRPDAPLATTDATKNATGTTVDVTGTVNPAGTETIVEAKYYPTGRPAEVQTAVAAVSPLAAGPFTAQPVTIEVSGLRPGTEYRARVQALNAEGGDQGRFVPFTTASRAAPSATTTAPPSVSARTATLAATVTPNGAETSVSFEYRKTGRTAFSSVPATESPFTGTSRQSASAAVDGLAPGTVYEVRATAANSVGEDTGRLKTFTTKNIGVTLTGGGFGGLGRTFRATPGEANQPIGLFRLTPTQGGVDLTEVSVTPDNPGVRGVDRISLWISGDDRFDPSGDTELVSLDLDPRADLPSPLTLGGFSKTLPAEARTLFVAVTLTGEAAGEVTGYLADQSALALEGGAITEVNGNEQTGFSNLPLSEEDSALPVELAAIEGTRVDGGVRLSWRTTSETNNAGFQVQRQRLQGSPGEWREVGFVEGAGTTSDPQTYRFTDADLPYAADSLRYRLKQVDVGGTATLTDPITIARGGPVGLELLGTAPNPASRRATVRYAVPEGAGGDVTLRLYDVLGRTVRTVTARAEAGRHTRTLDVSGLASGTYFLLLQAGGPAVTRKITVTQ